MRRAGHEPWFAAHDRVIPMPLLRKEIPGTPHSTPWGLNRPEGRRAP